MTATTTKPSKLYQKYHALIEDRIQCDPNGYRHGALVKEGFSKKDMDAILSTVFNRTKGALTDEECEGLKNRLYTEINQQGGLPLSRDYQEQGIKWLKNLYKTPTSKERANNPFGYREQAVLDQPDECITIMLTDFYSANGRWHTPVYDVDGNHPSNDGRVGAFTYTIDWRAMPKVGCYIIG